MQKSINDECQHIALYVYGRPYETLRNRPAIQETIFNMAKRQLKGGDPSGPVAKKPKGVAID